MTFKSAAIKTGIAAITLTALGLVAATPASAHTNNMYGFILDANPDNVPPFQGFATLGKTDGIATPLPTDIEFIRSSIQGIEVAGEKGTAVGYTTGPFVAPWDHTTGALGTKVPMLMGGSSQFEVHGLDTLNDGTTVTLIEFVPEQDVIRGIASVDAAGNVVLLVDLTAALADPEGGPLYDVVSLATDPATGVTYVFLELGDLSYYIAVTVATDTVGVVTSFDGPGFEEGVLGGADFDAADGSLYFVYGNFVGEGDTSEELSRLGAPATWPTAARQVISTFPGNDDSYILEELALTIEHTALAATGSELPILAIVLVGTVAVVAGGVTVTVARRRSEAGTV